jgi:hypothetical protein
MKSLLLLSLIGAAIYAVLHLSTPLPAPNANAVAAHTQDSRPAVIHPGSWASDLRSLKPRVASQNLPPTPWYDRKPRPKRQTVDGSYAAESSSEAESAPAALPKPKAVKAASRKAKWRAGSAQAEISGRVVRKSELKRPRWTRRAERRTRKTFNPNRAFLLGR